MLVINNIFNIAIIINKIYFCQYTLLNQQSSFCENTYRLDDNINKKKETPE